MSRFHALIGVAVIALVATVAGGQEQPDLERGFYRDQAYQAAGLDTVNLYSGNLTLAIPIGQRYHVGGSLWYGLTLYYNSNVWDYEQRDFYPPNTDGGCSLPPDSTPELLTVAKPTTLNNAGLGWNLSLGTLDGPYGSQDSATWVFTGPDGGTHAFYPMLHPSDDQSSHFRTTQSRSGWQCSASSKCDVWYTRDNTYLRLVAFIDSNNLVQGGDVEFPDGTVETFLSTIQPSQCTWGTLFCTNSNPAHLTQIADTFGNTLTVSYLYDANNNHIWQFQDSAGRTHTVTFVGAPTGGLVVGQIALAAFGGTQATYTFHYAAATIPRSGKQDSMEGYCRPAPTTAYVTFLAGIALPDGSSFCMNTNPRDFSGTPNYNCVAASPACPAEPKDDPGTLTQVTLPTGGTIAWTYAAWAQDPAGGACDPGGCSPTSTCSPVGWPLVAQESCGVAKREACDPVANPSQPVCGTWTYAHQSPYQRGTATPPAPNEATTTVTSPSGDDTVYYFRAQTCSGYDANQNPYGWDYGLPFTTNQSNTQAPYGVAYLSSQSFRGSASNNVVLRSSYVSYASDGLDPDASWYDSNRRVTGSRTVFNDDTLYGSNVYSETWLIGFDGFGHYRTAITGGNFDSGNGRITTVDYNPLGGWGPDNNWITGTFDYVDTQDGTSPKTRREACFDMPSTGALLRTRTLSQPPTTSGSEGESANDLIAVYTYTGGDVTSEQYYGGDAQPVTTGANGPPSLCGLALPATDAYRIDHTYGYGSTATSYYVDQGGTALPFYLVDATIDQDTGLPSSVRTRSGPDSAGIQTNLTYDAFGRLITSQPAAGNGAWMRNDFTPWSAQTPQTSASVASCAKPNGVTSACVSWSDSLVASAVQYDGLGRPYLAKQLLPSTDAVCTPGGCWNQRLTSYSAMNWITSVSELQPSGASSVVGTTYSAFDPFGRPGSIQAADGSTASLQYLGARQVSRTVSVNGNAATTTQTYDRQGRLWKVQEPTGGAIAQYSYDSGNRLTGVNMTGGTAAQTRAFAYDGRGFLEQETLPELGPGTITYGSSATQPYYDAAGNALRRFDGVSHLVFSFDRAGRLTQVQTADGSWHATGTLRTFSFGPTNGAGNWAKGMLSQAAGTTAFDGGTAVVTESYTYGGTAGAISQKSTEVNVTGTTAGDFDLTFGQSFTWNDLGHLASQSYPSAPGITSGRTVYNTYTAGFLTGVLPYYAPSITYNPNATVAAVTHASGVTTTQIVADGQPGHPPDWMARPISISTSGATLPGGGNGNWTTNTYSYDGVGNVTTMGADTFTYDLVSRLTSASVAAYSGTAESYSYDAYGNLTTYAGRSLSTDPTTNRLTQPGLNAQYDAAGNLLQWNNTVPGITYTLTYTPMNQLSSVSGGAINWRLAYTAGGERVVVRDGTSTMLTLRGPTGQVASELTYDGTNWRWSKDYVYRDVLLLSSVSATTGVVNYALDHLGSPRLATNRCGEQTNLFITNPFGKDKESYPQAAERMRFTIHERDIGDPTKTSDDIDNMHSRSYLPYLARFTSVDLVRGEVRSPQSLNLFAFVRGNPVSRLDPLGLADDAPFADQSMDGYWTSNGDAAAEGVTEGPYDFGLIQAVQFTIPVSGTATVIYDTSWQTIPTPTFTIFPTGSTGSQPGIIDYMKKSRFILNTDWFHPPCNRSFGQRVADNVRVTNESYLGEAAYLVGGELYADWVAEQAGLPTFREWAAETGLKSGMEVAGVYQSALAMGFISGMEWAAGGLLAWPTFEAGVRAGSALNVAWSPCDALSGL